MRENRWKENGAQGASGAQNVANSQLMGKDDDNRLKEELKTCNYILVNSDNENASHRIYIFSKFTVDKKCLLEKLDVVFGILKRAANLNVAIGFVLKYVEGESCMYYEAHENNTLLERSTFVATTQYLTKIKNILNKTNVFA